MCVCLSFSLPRMTLYGRTGRREEKRKPSYPKSTQTCNGVQSCPGWPSTFYPPASPPKHLRL